MSDTEFAAEFILRGGHLALDFITTEKRGADGGIADLLATPADLERWLTGMGLRAKGEKNTDPLTPALLDEARVLRRALRGLAAAQAEEETAPEEAIAAVNRVLQVGAGYLTLEADGPKFHSHFERTEKGPLQVLVPIAEAMVDLLTSPQAARIRRCGNPRCILYFLDTSKNGTRRWCSMSGCGNVMKAAAHYRRQKGVGSRE